MGQWLVNVDCDGEDRGEVYTGENAMIVLATAIRELFDCQPEIARIEAATYVIISVVSREGACQLEERVTAEAVAKGPLHRKEPSNN